MDNTPQWPQEMVVVKSMEEMVGNSTCSSERRGSSTKPRNEQGLNCPRCNSTNTKFCYYNNYSLSQPRHFCKACKRYWTAGGSLRNIPVGGCSRKNKRSSSSSSSSRSSSSSSSKNKLSDHMMERQPLHITCSKQYSSLVAQDHLQNPKIHDTQDLNLCFPPTTHHDFKTLSELIQVPNFDNNKNYMMMMPPPPNCANTYTATSSAMELLTGISNTASRGLSYPFMPMPITDPNMIYSSSAGYSMQQEFKPTLNFSLDGGLGTSGGGHGGVDPQESSGRHLFPLKEVSNTSTSGTGSGGHEHINRDSNGGGGGGGGFWNGMLGGGSWI